VQDENGGSGMKSFIGLIFRKELLEIFRDRRSVIMALALPLVLYPLMFWIIGSQAAVEIHGPSMIRIAAGAEAREDILAILNDPIFDDFHWSMYYPDDPMEALTEGRAEIAAVLTDDSSAAVSLRFIYDANKTSSIIATSHLASLLVDYNQSVQIKALFEMDIDLAALAPVYFEMSSLESETGDETGSAGIFLSIVMPMLLVVLLSVGGMPTAVDLFAGEKERRTFEPLLCTAARRTDILAGKLGAVTVISLLGVLASGAGMYLGFIISPSAMTMGLDDAQGLILPPITILLTLLIIMAMAVFFSGLHVLLSTYARTVKEASTYGSFVMLAAYIPTFASMNKLGGDFDFWTAFVPIMNISGCLKMVLGGIHNPAYMTATLGTTAAFVGVVLLAGRYMFTKENIMLRA
jgi:sodium transport system permease protein